MRKVCSLLGRVLITAGVAAIVGSARAGTLAVGETNEAGEYRPNLAATNVNDVAPSITLDSDGRFTINNAKWVVYDEDLDILNARSDVKRLTVASTSTFIFDNTTKGTTTENVFWSSSGTFIKRGASTMVVTGKNYRWAGSRIYIQEGTWEQAGSYSIASSTSNDVYIADGAALRLNDASTFSGAVIYAQGTGVNGGGAIIIDAYQFAPITRLVLEDDALLVVNAEGSPGPSGSVIGGYTNTKGAAGKINPAELSLNGHTLTIGGSAKNLCFYNLRTFGENGGDIVFLPRTDGLVFSLMAGASDEFENFDLSHVDSITLPQDSTLRIGNGIQDPITPNWICEGDTTISCYLDSSVRSRILTGSISIAANKTLNLCPNVQASSSTDWTLDLRGNITGEGSVAFGTAETPAGGAVYLRGTNTYEGATAVNGQSSFVVYACNEQVLPESSSLTVNSGKYLPVIFENADGSASWSGEKIVACYEKFGATTIEPDISNLTNATRVTISSALVAEAFPDGVLWSATGSGEGGYTLTGPYTRRSGSDVLDPMKKVLLFLGAAGATITLASSAPAGVKRPAFVLPETIWAAPDLECNIYFDSSLDSVRPEIYAYEARCAVGRCENARWTWKPTKEDAGRAERLILDAWSDFGLQASVTVTVRVAKLPKVGTAKVTMALLADSLVGGRFQDWIMKDVRDAGWVNFTPIGSHSGPSVSEICRPGEAAHDGYGGFRPIDFLDLYQLTEGELKSINSAAELEQLKAMGEVVPDTPNKMLLKSPLVRIVNGKKTVDVQAWLDKINGGKPPDFIGIQLGVNETCTIRDAEMDAGYCERKQVEPMRRLIRLLRACAPEAEIGVGISEIGATDQDAFGRNYGCAVSRLQARKNMFRLNRLWIALVKEFNDAGDGRVFAVPHGPATDQDFGIRHEQVPAFDGSEILVSRAANAYHPTKESARQTGGAYAAWVLCRLGEKR